MVIIKNIRKKIRQELVGGSLPDLDTDFEMARRGEVKEYMERRYGKDQVCSVGTYTTLQVKAAIKDLCRLEGVPVSEVNMFTAKIDGVKDFDDLFRMACQKKDVAYFINKYPGIIQAVGLIQGQPKAKSIHACAMMVYPDDHDMFHWNPVRRQGDMMVSEWEGGELDGAGFLKEDILGILQLSKFGDILKLVKEHTGKDVDIYTLPLDDKNVYTYFQKGWTGDVFHFGAKGLTGYCRMMKPDNITELVNCIGLYRPGVMEGNFHNEYILRKNGEREVSFRKGSDEILQDTRYIMIWQEQTMKMFQKLGGFNLVEADSARRCLDENTLFWSEDKGWITIKDIRGEYTRLFDFDKWSVKSSKVNRSFSSGVKECVQLQFTGGDTLCCTPDHEVYTEIGWIRADQTKGHFMLKDLSPKHGKDVFSQQELYLVAGIVTEGCHRDSSTLTFVNKDLSEIELFKSYYKDFFGEGVRNECVGKNDVITLHLNPKFCELIDVKVGLSDSREIPDRYMFLSGDCKAFLLSKMIDFDGYVIDGDKCFIGYSSKSEKLINQVKLLIESFGVQAILKKRFLSEYNSFYYEVLVCSYEDCMKLQKVLIYSKKIAGTVFNNNGCEYSRSKLIPKEIWQPFVERLIKGTGYYKWELLSNDIKWNRDITRDALKRMLSKIGRCREIEQLIKGDFAFVKVNDIVSVGKRHVYDFSMGYKCFPWAFVGGYLVHNCIGKKDVSKLLPFKERFLKHYTSNFGVDQKYAEDTWKEIENMAAYQFNHCISGYERIMRSTRNRKLFNPTIEEMYNIMNDRSYAIKHGRLCLHDWYVKNGYGKAWSLNENDEVILNNIVDIRWSGFRKTYKVETESGLTVSVTDNHKIPTKRGEFQLKDIVVGDEIFIRDEKSVGNEEKYPVRSEKIISIEFDREENVYDVEMADPYHTVTMNNGIVVCNSHAVAYANTGYACEWLKVNYPLEYWSVAFSYADDDDYPVYLHEINEIGNIKVLPPDINESTDKIKTDFNDNSLVWSISSVKQVGEKAQVEIMEERSKNGPYFSFEEFLDRHSQKGSAVNKSVIENLVSCGAFDKLESISIPVDRLRLIDRYRELNKVKIDKEKDPFESNPDKRKYAWWYSLRQKRLCGLAFFDYPKLYADYFKEMLDRPDYPFKDFSEIVDDPVDNKSLNLTVGGYVYDIEVKSGKKGEYAIITLEQNYQFRIVVFWANEYASFESILKTCKNSILFMNGRTNWDGRNQQTAIYANESTEVLVLT